MSDDFAPSHVITPGGLQDAYRLSLNRLIASDSLRRLWAKDPSLWPGDERARSTLAASLAWLDVPHYLPQYLASFAAIVDAAHRDGFRDVVLVATDEPNLLMDAPSHASSKMHWRRVFLLDNVDPAAIRAIDEKLDFAHTLFVFANKSGKQIETHSLFLYFLERSKALGAADPGRFFVAVTEDGSYLADHASSYGFRAVLLDPPGMHHRYSSLLHFALLSALWQIDPTDVASRMAAMHDLCQVQSPPTDNPALALAALLAAGAGASHGKLPLLATKSMQPATHRIAQLVGGCTSGADRGIIAYSGASHRNVEAYREGAIAVALAMCGDDDAAIQDAESRMIDQGVPTVSIHLHTPADIGGSIFVWEVATALACSQMGVNPFATLNKCRGTHRSLAIVEHLAARGELPTLRPRALEKGLQLYAEGETRLQISTLNFSEALRTFFELRPSNGYLRIISFLDDSNAQARAMLSRLQDELASALEIPVLLSKGPRGLHCFEERHNGRTPNGLFLILTAEPTHDVAIPGAGYTFGQLQLAFAMAAFDALQSRQQFVVRLHLAAAIEPSLADLDQVIHQVLSNLRVLTR